MEKRTELKVISIVACVAILSVGFYFCFNSVKPKVDVGIFYYTWYGAPKADNWNAAKYVDFPISDLGNYSSSDPMAALKQLRLMEDAGIDFVIISWWGFYDDYQKFIDGAAKQIFTTAQVMASNGSFGHLRIALMVEPFDNNEKAYNYTAIYDHINSEFVQPYSSIYYTYCGKPLLCFYEDLTEPPNLTNKGKIPLDSRFKVVIVGQQSYAQWTYTDLAYEKPSHPQNNQVSVTPRYDDSRLNRTHPIMTNANLTEGTSDQEWEKAIQLYQQGKINIITISTWNEYPERTMIEPHYDGTAKGADPYLLYNQTKFYISQLKK
jgi:hypothetical protein